MTQTHRTRRPRIVLYSHDTQGLGHIRRNLLIADTLARSEAQPIVLLVTGIHEAAAFPMPPGVDCLTLPALAKDEEGGYRARSLSLPLRRMTRLRAQTIRAALRSFAPDVLVVDKVPSGACGELRPTLKELKAQGSTRLVLGLRDVLDDAATVAREWHGGGEARILQTFYDAVWVYGDPRVYNPLREYGLVPGEQAQVHFSGYLGRRFPTLLPAAEAERRESWNLPDGPLALCLVGGGQDGFRLAASFAGATFPAATTGVIVTGPFMPEAERDHLQQLAAQRPDLRVMTFITEPEALVSMARQVVAMGGYNTVCELLAARKRTLVVPRVRPRLEQLIRAERLQALGLLDLLHPERLSTASLSAWLAAEAPPAVKAGAVDLGGLSRLPGLLADALPTAPRRWEVAHARP